MNDLIHYLYGEGRGDLLVVLLGLILIDWMTGIAASLKDKKHSSDYRISGILRTLFILSFPAIGNMLDRAVETPGFLFYGVTFGLIYHTFNSMTANAVRAGWGRFIPPQVVEFVRSTMKSQTNRALKKTHPPE
ncbi:phage holin family protein [Brevibacillus sp. H7]|uniref:phage holin family protein n=1 Tax=Brevibacillus sp. H7 TaxID=3349138 RepID=UPI0038148699